MALYLQRIRSRSTRDDHSATCWHDIKYVVMKMRAKHISCAGCRYRFFICIVMTMGWVDIFNTSYRAILIFRGHFFSKLAHERHHNSPVRLRYGFLSWFPGVTEIYLRSRCAVESNVSYCTAIYQESMEQWICLPLRLYTFSSLW